MCNRCVNFRQYGSIERLNEVFGAGWVYIGRGNPRLNLPHSPLANRYSHHRSANAVYVPSRAEAVASYRRWLWGEMQAGNGEVLGLLERIGREALVVVCWCAPEACHGEVVLRAAEWREERMNYEL